MNFPSGLEPHPFRFQLGNRLKNTGKLKTWLMALAEAVQNSLDSLRDSQLRGDVTVTIEREKDLLSDGLGPIRSVIVHDEGAGFDDTNLESFVTPDSSHKHDRGGKGLGRIMCLQAFDRIEVDSVYESGPDLRRRRMILQVTEPELAVADSHAQSLPRVTEVRLVGLKDVYTKATIGSDEIAEWLIEHFLAILIEGPKWLKSLILKDGAATIDLAKKLQGRAEWSNEFRIGTYDFRLACYAVSGDSKCDRVRLVAAGRIVDSNTQPVEHYLQHLGTIHEEKSCLILVHSPFFDEHVNDARNGVSFSDDAGDGILTISAAEFRTACAQAMREKLTYRLQESTAKFRERVRQVVDAEAPNYRPLLQSFFDSKEFTNLSSKSKEEEILASLDTFRRREAQKLRQESKRIASLKADEDGYWERARDFVQQIETQKKVALAEYVTLRRIILDRLKQLIETGDDGKGHREAEIHNLIFPQRVATDSTPGADHQLWILDERLESHDYLASDQPLQGKRGDRPDLLIALDQPGAFASEPNSRAAGYERIVLVEFKRGLLDLAKVPTDDLPHQQMMRYARQIIDHKTKHHGSGRPITVQTNSRFYMYAVCEISPQLLDRLVEQGFTRAPSGDGAFNAQLNAGKYYIEYISLPKLLEDAQARNSAFFKRLGFE